MAIKTFTAGSILTAADTNTYLANSGLVYLNRFTATGASTALLCDNIFTTDYDDYRVIVNLRGTANTTVCYFQYVDTAGSTVGTGYYSTAYGQDFTSGATGFTVSNSTTTVSVGWLPNSTTQRLNATFDICNPRSSTLVTQVMGNHTGISSGASYFGGALYSMTTATTAMRGIRFDNTGIANMTGTVTVYGYRKP